MPLSIEDINRITELGFPKDFFVVKRNGWLQLKNYHNRCVFHNGKICSIYPNRPEGCKLYPIIYDMDAGCAIFDSECPHRDKFLMSKNKKRRLFTLVKILEYEKK